MTAPLTEAEIERLMQQWLKAVSDPRALRRNHRQNLRRNLSRRTRFTLWRQRRANAVFIWLCHTRKGSAIARRLWRL